MKNRYWLLLFVSLLGLLLVACSSGSSGEGDGNGSSSGETIVIKGGLTVGDWAPHHVALAKLKEVVEGNSDDMVVEIYPDSQLGGEREMLEGVQQGSLEFAAISSSVFAAFDERFTAIDIPYLV